MRATRSLASPAHETRTRASTAPAVVSTTTRPPLWTMPVARAPVRSSPPRRVELARVGAGHFAVVDDAGLGDEERRDARGVRLALAELLDGDSLHAHEAVGASPPLQLLEARDLFPGRRDDDLAAAVEGDAVLLAEALEERAAARARARLERAGLVVEARVNDAAVAPRLMQRDAPLPSRGR